VASHLSQLAPDASAFAPQTSAAATAPVSRPFLRTPAGVAAMVLMTAGAGYAIYSASHDRKPVKSPIRKVLVGEEESIFRTAHATLMPIASPEPFELYDTEIGALIRRRRLPDGAESLSDRRLLEFCRGSLALLGQASLLDTLRQFDFATMTVPPPVVPEK